MSAEKDRLYALEDSLAKDANPPSCTPAFITRPILGVGDVAGLTVVDLAGGTSNLTAEFLKEGADAHAIDIVYDRTPEELARVALDLCYDQVEQAPYEYRRQMRKYGEETIEQFLDSYEAFPERYRKAFFTRLPYGDDFADLTVSANGITALASDVELTLERVREALRVTKPGGRLIMAPIDSPRGVNFYGFEQQHAEIMMMLIGKGCVVEYESEIIVPVDIEIDLQSRLTVTKPLLQ